MTKRSVRKFNKNKRHTQKGQIGGSQATLLPVYLPVDKELLESNVWFPLGFPSVSLTDFDDVEKSERTLGAPYSVFVKDEESYKKAIETIKTTEQTITKLQDRPYFDMEFKKMLAEGTAVKYDAEQVWLSWQTYGIELKKMIKNWQRDMKHYLLREVLNSLEQSLQENFNAYMKQLPQLETKVLQDIQPLLTKAQEAQEPYVKEQAKIALPKATADAIEKKVIALQQYFKDEKEYFGKAAEEWQTINASFNHITPLLEWTRFSPETFFSELKDLHAKEVEIATVEANLQTEIPSQSYLENLRNKIKSLETTNDTNDKEEYNKVKQELEGAEAKAKALQEQRTQIESQVPILKQKMDMVRNEMKTTRQQKMQQKMQESLQYFEDQYSSWKNDNIGLLEKTSGDLLLSLQKRAIQKFSQTKSVLEPDTLPPLLAKQQQEIKKAEQAEDAQADAKIALLQKEEQDLVKKDIQEFREKQTEDLAAKSEEDKKKKRKEVESSTTDLQEVINQYEGSLASLKGLSDTVANSLQEASSFDSKIGTAQQQMQTLSVKLEENAKDIEVVRNESAEVKILLSTLNGYKEKVQTYRQSLTAFQGEVKEKIRECEVSEPILNSYQEGIVEKLKRLDSGEDVEAIFLDVGRQLEESRKVANLTKVSLTTLQGKESSLQKEKTAILDLFKKVDEMLEKTKTLSESYGKEKENYLESNLERKQEDLTRKATDDKSLVDTIRITAETSLKQIDQLLTQVPTILELEKPLSTIQTEDGQKLALELTAVLEKVKIQRNNLNEKKSDLTISLQKAISTSKQIQDINSAVKAATSDLETKRDQIVEALNKVKVFHDDLNGSIDVINKSRDGVLEAQQELNDLHDKAKQFRSLIDQAEKVITLSQPQSKNKTEKNNKLIETYRNVANQANAIVQQGGQHAVVETARQIAVDALKTIQELENENTALQQRGGKRKTRKSKNKQ